MSTVTKPILKDETGVRIAQGIEALQAIGRPTSEQVELAVGEYLNDHPELVTTVDFSIATKVFGTVADMLADNTLKAGDNVATRAYYAAGDNGGNNYVISATHTGVFYLTLNNGLYANLLSENGILRAESIGIKAYAAATENPDSTDMTRNVTLFNAAVYNGVYLLFGKGHYYFNDKILLANKNTYTIRGASRETTVFHFPSSVGFYFSDAIYYNYYVITGLQILSYGDCIKVSEDCYSLLDSHFEWLILKSETGNCFTAPSYNIAKRINQDSSVTYDLCVQNAVFDFVNAQASQGAAFCNIMGMFTYYRHMNFVSCKYAFRNCDGILEQANNLGNQQDYYIYYDKTNDYGLRWLFINVNAEGLSKAFIFTEPRQNAGQDEDPRKPETANIMKIAKLTAIDSYWSLYGVSSGHDIYPITVQDIGNIFLINSDGLVHPSGVPAGYPAAYDTTVVKGEIRSLDGASLAHYEGGPTITVVSLSNAYNYSYKGSLNRALLVPSISVGEDNRKLPPYYDEIRANGFIGGRSRQVYWHTHSTDSGIVFTTSSIPYEYAFYDVLDIKLTSTGASSNVALVNFLEKYQDVGKIITIRNNSASTKPLVLKHNYNNSSGTFYFSDGQDVTLNAGEVAHIIVSMQNINGTLYKVGKKLTIS